MCDTVFDAFRGFHCTFCGVDYVCTEDNEEDFVFHNADGDVLCFDCLDLASRAIRGCFNE